MNNKDQDFDEIDPNNRKKMTQNLNSGASEQMRFEKISDEELKDPLKKKKIKLDQKGRTV